MKDRSKRGPSFVISADLHQAAFNLWGRSNEITIANAMSSPKSRALLRAEQLRLALLQKARPANEAPAGDNANDTPAASSGGSITSPKSAAAR
jgi:hypothetical protein